MTLFELSNLSAEVLSTLSKSFITVLGIFSVIFFCDEAKPTTKSTTTRPTTTKSTIKTSTIPTQLPTTITPTWSSDSGDNATENSTSLNRNNNKDMIIIESVSVFIAVLVISAVIVRIVLTIRKRLNATKPPAYTIPVHSKYGEEDNANTQYAHIEQNGANNEYANTEHDSRTYYNDPEFLRVQNGEGIELESSYVLSTGSKAAGVELYTAKGTTNSPSGDDGRGNQSVFAAASQSDGLRRDEASADAIAFKEGRRGKITSPSQEKHVYYNDLEGARSGSSTSDNDYDEAAVVKMNSHGPVSPVAAAVNRTNRPVLSEDNVILVENTLYS